MGPDLEAPRRAVEELMSDTCDIRRPAGGLVVDPVTLALVMAPGNAPLIYGPDTLGAGDRPLLGKVKFRARSGTEPAIVDSAGRTLVGRSYVVKVPWDAPVPTAGDIVTCLTSQNDPALPGLKIVIVEPVRSTLLVQRQLLGMEVPG